MYVGMYVQVLKSFDTKKLRIVRLNERMAYVIAHSGY